MGRKPLEWGAVLLYYVFFYAFLAGFWAACMAGFLRTIDRSQPTQQGNFSMLKANPGMTFEPMVTTDNTIIEYSGNNYSDLVTRMDSILQPYWDAYNALKNNTGTQLQASCSADGKNSARGYACVPDMSQIPDECNKANYYGYRSGAPCIFLRANKVYGFMPTPYGNVTAETSQEVPLPSPTLYKNYDPNYIGITCEGENDGDRDSIMNVTFYPPQGVPFYFFPYYNQPNYLPPFVMARFQVQPGRGLMVWCRLWAQNVKHDKTDVQGSIHFELFVNR